MDVVQDVGRCPGIEGGRTSMRCRKRGKYILNFLNARGDLFWNDPMKGLCSKYLIVFYCD